MLLAIVQTVVAVLLITAILLQVQGSGLSAVFGQSVTFYRSKRSMERLLVIITILLAVAFAFFSILQLIPLG